MTRYAMPMLRQRVSRSAYDSSSAAGPKCRIGIASLHSMTDSDIADALFRLLDSRSPTATVCPSEVARALAPGAETAWRALMPEVRRVASGLAAANLLRVTRKGVPVDAMGPGGPIRLGRP